MTNLNIIVCIKQVPDVDDIKWTPENNLDRGAMLSKINLYDDWALDFAAKIKNENPNTQITAISMGPLQAKDILEYALAKGAQRAILLSDKAFSGSDTLITAEILAKAIKKYCANYNIILTGQMAQDGDTAQVPVSLAQKLGICDLINCSEILQADNEKVILTQEIDEKIFKKEIKTPCLIAISKQCKNGKASGEIKIEDYIKAQNQKIEVYNAQDLEFSKENTGVIGSPTMVYRVYRAQSARNAIKIEENITTEILKILKQDN